jgi:hypothetical protein
MGRVVHGASCPCGELSVGRAVHGVKCPWGEMSVGRAVRGANCPWGELSLGRTVPGANCPWGELSLGQTVPGAKCPWGELSRGEFSWGELSWGEFRGGEWSGNLIHTSPVPVDTALANCSVIFWQLSAYCSVHMIIFFFSLYVFGEPEVHFRNFLLCCPSQRSARCQVPSQVATHQEIGSQL